MATTTAKPTFTQTTPPQLEDLPFKDYDPEVARQLLAFIKPYTRTILISVFFMAVSSLAAAGIHFAVIGEHFKEYALFGVFFALVAWVQALWALGVVVAPTRPLLLAGVVVNAVVVLVWVVSRTVGLPLGPESGAAEPVAFLDVLSTVIEVGIVLGAGLLLARPSAARGGHGGLVAVVVLTIALVVLTTVAVAVAPAEHPDEGMDMSMALVHVPGS